MMKNTTQVPNILFDEYLAELTVSELKILMVIIRQTNGWINKGTGRRKVRDRISHSQFIRKTGLSRRSVSLAIKKLQIRRLIQVTDTKGNYLATSQRRGRYYVFYSMRKPSYERSYKVMRIADLISYSTYGTIREHKFFHKKRTS